MHALNALQCKMLSIATRIVRIAS